MGAMLGLVCTVRLRDAPTTGRRTWWLVLAAWGIGGTSIWTMHFMAMLGFRVSGTQIRYDIGLTVASAVLAIVFVAIGLFIVGLGRPTAVKIVTGGVLTGLGVAAMHYTGMAAMRLNGRIEYDPLLVGVSVGIAIAAATVALWMAVRVRRPAVIVVSALVMGLAVNGMHFTGMFSMSAHLHGTPSRLGGVTAATLIVPIVFAVIVVAVGLAYALVAASTDEDRAGLAFLEAQIADRDTAAAPAPTPARTGLRVTDAGRFNRPR
ncbi:MHYT domain-containing protein [Polymorphospora lycopeni]|uniref:MHYT domain-containing protein n=1 Tax=Polymorphospora lycopeni TaxID=3140240 RepID=A0ABV5CJI9_9ACTN